VTGVITRYDREGLSFLSADVATPQDYRVDITAHITARERATGRVLLNNKDVHGDTLVHVGSDLADAERQALPLLAQDLARNINELLTEGTWLKSLDWSKRTHILPPVSMEAKNHKSL
jgi:hypothetical protein